MDWCFVKFTPSEVHIKNIKNYQFLIHSSYKKVNYLHKPQPFEIFLLYYFISDFLTVKSIVCFFHYFYLQTHYLFLANWKSLKSDILCKFFSLVFCIAFLCRNTNQDVSFSCFDKVIIVSLNESCHFQCSRSSCYQVSFFSSLFPNFIEKKIELVNWSK